MTGTPHRTADAVRRLGLRVVLLAFWGTAAALSRWCGGPLTSGGESVRRKA
ncbi:hypothetical protein [Streptomyces sp. NPDC050422]|uniref:hypothetical protein n=1 Tax=Streptomyces sp. NPDC050422 TaxID=3365614 RepID=UPI0037B7F718